jgi:hypothetical protein
MLINGSMTIPFSGLRYLRTPIEFGNLFQVKLHGLLRRVSVVSLNCGENLLMCLESGALRLLMAG